MMSCENTGQDELQDLSPADAQELRAFVDKRRWFEEKLKQLEGMPHIYPFVHPALESPDFVSSASEPKYQAREPQWTLPTTEEIQRWQSERAALEEEIIAFDDGDLARMKQKTRAATLLPLTPPSTHLVSITLALIVLVDRLMVLLRHRADLLELTSLRLQWDQIRWQIMLETNRVRAEIDTIAKTKGRWVPPTSSIPRSEAKTPSRVSRSGDARIGTPATQSSALPTLPSAPNDISNFTNPPTTPQKSPMAIRMSRFDSSDSLSSLDDRNSPKRSLHLPLLQSSIVSLDVRRKNMSTTLVSRSGKILDKMIDLALPLRQLGGTDGPTAEDQQGGAVPDELLDIQDDIENDLNDIESRLECCKELKEQWTKADEHYLASGQAEEAGNALLEQIRSACANATTEDTTNLSELMDEANRLVPSPIDSSFSRPLHPAYPDFEQYNKDLIDTLCHSRAKALDVLSQSQKTLDWYLRLGTAKQRLEQQVEYVTQQRETLERVLILVESGHDENPRPILDLWPATDSQVWLDELPNRLDAVQAAMDVLAETNQRFTVDIMRHRRMVKEMPDSVREILSQSEMNNLETGNDLSDDALEAIARAKKIMQEAQRDAAILPMLLSLKSVTRNIGEAATTYRITLKGSTTLSTSAELTNVERQVTQLHKRYRSDVDGTLNQINQSLDSQDRAAAALRHRLDTTCTSLHDTLENLQVDIKHAIVASRRREEPDRIDSEATVFLERIRSKQATVNAVGSSDSDADGHASLDGIMRDIEPLSKEIEEWTDGLSDRVLLLLGSPTSPTSPTSTNSFSEGPGPIASVELCGPTSAQDDPVTHDSNNVSAIVNYRSNDEEDDRQRINNIVARLHGSLDHLRRETAQLTRKRPARAISPRSDEEVEQIDRVAAGTPGSATESAEEDVFGIVTPVAQDHSDLAEITFESVKQRLANLHIDALLHPSLEQLESNTSYRMIPSSPIAKRIRSELQSIAIALDLLRKSASDDQRDDIETLDTMFASAEEGLSRLDKLAAVSRAVQAADEVCSLLLEALDGYPKDGETQVKSEQDIAQQAVRALRDAAEHVEDDARVTQEMQRVENAWTELYALVEDTLHSGFEELDTVSESSSLRSMAVVSKDQGGRSASTPRLSYDPTKASHFRHTEPRNRSTSDTPSRSTHSLSSGLPRLRATSMGRTNIPTPPPSSPRPGHSLLPRSSRLSLSTSSKGTPKTKIMTPKAHHASRSSLAKSTSSSQSRREYVADPKSKLDVAVGRIVNTLKVDVPIKPVGVDSGDEWKDQSGKYWIGAEGRAKLCFCRILRSKTVMVRVGGGWAELSKFLMDHFADSLTGWDPSAGPAGIGIGSSAPVPITSASNIPHQPPPHTRIPTSTTALTPAKQVRSPAIGTPHKTPQTFTTISPEPNSPLVPLHFIRRASESPPVRQREEDSLNTGKRSILGRSSSGNVGLEGSPEKK